MEEQGMKIEDFYIAIKKRWLLISALIIIPVMLVLLIPQKTVVESQYKAIAKIRVMRENSNNYEQDDNEMIMEQKMINNLVEELKSTNVIKAAVGNVDIEDFENEVLSNLTIEVLKDTTTINLTLKGENEEIKIVLNNIVNYAGEATSKIVPNHKMEVVSDVELVKNSNEISSNKGKKVVLVLLGMAFLSTLTAITLEYFDDSFKHEEDVEKDLNIPVLVGIFRKSKNNEKDLAYKKLVSLLRFNNENIKSILVTSTLKDENKEECVFAVASELLNLGEKVIIIDSDNDNNFDFKGDMIKVNGEKEILSSIKNAKNDYDYVLVNGPDINMSNISQIISKEVDGTILVIKAYKAKRKLVLKAVKEIKKYNNNIVGTVLNNIES